MDELNSNTEQFAASPWQLTPPQPSSDTHPPRKRKPGNNKGALVAMDDTAIINRVANGEMPTSIAAEFGVTPAALSIRFHGNPEWVRAREQGMETRLDRFVEAIDHSDDMLSLARAKEGFRATAWRAEREHPARWGQRTHTTVEHVGDLGDKLRRARERLVGQSSTDDRNGAAQLTASGAVIDAKPAQDDVQAIDP